MLSENSISIENDFHPAASCQTTKNEKYIRKWFAFGLRPKFSIYSWCWLFSFMRKSYTTHLYGQLGILSLFIVVVQMLSQWTHHVTMSRYSYMCERSSWQTWICTRKISSLQQRSQSKYQIYSTPRPSMLVYGRHTEWKQSSVYFFFWKQLEAIGSSACRQYEHISPTKNRRKKN